MTPQTGGVDGASTVDGATAVDSAAAGVPAAARDLAWSGCVNVRDIGGLPTRDGRRTRTGVLIRAEALHHLDLDGVSAVGALGPGAIIDLRSNWELGEPHPFAESPAYRRIPWIDDERDAERDPDTERTLADLYRGSLDRNTRQVAAIVGAVADTRTGPVVVHCHAGKDRTGLLVAVLLDLVGVVRDEIAADYALSEARLASRAKARAAAEPVETQGSGGIAALFARTLPETILRSLQHLDRQHGGSRGYLTACGVQKSMIEEVSRRLLAD
ncbi:MAG: tyrosine-protein phosphatase [Micromonosporaceae bacterium]